MKKNPGLLKRFVKKTAWATATLLAAKTIVDFINSIELKDKVVLITGGSRGLGIILARQLADEGARVVICARSEESLREASEDLASRAANYLAIPCDITDREQVKSMVQEISEKMGSIDILINNAGMIQTGPMESMKEADYESAMKVHFWGPFYVINEVLPEMMKKKQSRIVNIVSIGGKVSFPHLLPYNTSKYALAGYSEGLAAELQKYNIKVTTIYPGLMRTGSPPNIDVKGQHEKEYAWFKILDSLPFVSMDAELAGRKIIEAMKKGSKTLTLTIPAKLATAVHGIAPGLTITIFDLINFILPEMDDSVYLLTKKTEEAAKQNLGK